MTLISLRTREIKKALEVGSYEFSFKMLDLRCHGTGRWVSPVMISNQSTDAHARGKARGIMRSLGSALHSGFRVGAW